MALKSQERGFPDGAVVRNPPANAGDRGSSPGLGGSHMPWSGWAREPQLRSLRATATGPVHPGARAPQPEGPQQ